MKIILLGVDVVTLKRMFIVIALLGVGIYSIISVSLLKTHPLALQFSLDGSQHHQTSHALSSVVCKDILGCLTEGSWVARKGITTDELQKRQRIEQEIYAYLGFPKMLYRDDDKCGINHTIYGSNKQPALCNPYGSSPCCNENTGTCGRSKGDCQCDMCTDFSRYIHAEFAQWVPSNAACRFDVFNQRTACELLDTHVNELVFIGDSMTRHFFTAMAILLTNNPTAGAHKVGTKLRAHCQGEYQFIDNGKHNCQLAIAHAWDELNRTQVCNGRARFKTSLVEAYYSPTEAQRAVKQLLNKTGTVVVMNVGLHMKRSSGVVIARYLGPILNMIEKKGNGWPRLIWHNLHSVDNFLRTSVIETFLPWKRYNVEMSRYCQSRGIPVLEFYDMTQNIKSYDGLHVGIGGNLQKAQVLLNFLRDWSNQCKNY